MLPTSGYFKSVNCPFFESGLCERPHCHFRHVKKEINVLRPRGNSTEDILSGLSNTTADGKPDLLRLVTEAVRKMKEEVEQEQRLKTLSSPLVPQEFKANSVLNKFKKDEFPFTEMPSAAVADGKFSELPKSSKKADAVKASGSNKYTDTIDATSSKNSQDDSATSSSVVEYKPTPIAQLKKMQQENKYIKAAKITVRDEMEYDPVSNFSAGLPKKNKIEYKPRNMHFGILKPLQPNRKDSHSKKKVKFSVDDDYADESCADDDKEVSKEKTNDLEAVFSDDEVSDKPLIVNDTVQALLTEADDKNDEEISETSDNKFDIINQILCQSKKSEMAILNKSKRVMPSIPNEKSTEKVDAIKNTKKLSEATENTKDSDAEKRAASKSKSSPPKTVSSKSHSHKNSEKKVKSDKTEAVEKASKRKHLENRTEKKENKVDSHKNAKNKSNSHHDKHSHKGSDSNKRRHSDDDNHVNKKPKVKSSSKCLPKEETSSKKSKTSKTDSNKKERHKISSKDSQSKKVQNSSVSHKKEKSNFSNHKTQSTEKLKSNKLAKSSREHSKPNKSKVSSSDSDSMSSYGDNEAGMSDYDSSVDDHKSRTSSLTSAITQNHKLGNKYFSSPPQTDLKPLGFGDCKKDDVYMPDYDDLDTDLDEHDTYEECLRIFNEYVPPSDQNDSKHEMAYDKMNTKFQQSASNEETVHGKHRLAHTGTISNKQALVRKSLLSNPLPSKVSPAQVMFNRYASTKNRMQQEVEILTAPVAPSSFLSTVSTASNKKRIAHVPNATALIRATTTVKSKVASSPPNTLNSRETGATISQTNPKGNARIAHMPKLLSLPRPIIPIEYGSKVPSNIRQRYLNLIIDECLKIYDGEEDAYERGLEEEKNAYDRSSNRTVYLNVAINTIKRLRNEIAEGTTSDRVNNSSDTHSTPRHNSSATNAKPGNLVSKTNIKTLSHEFVLGGKKAANVSYSIERPRNSSKGLDEIPDVLFYQLLQSYLANAQELDDNGFPRPHPLEHGRAVILNQEKKMPVSSLERICCRCGARYKVTSKGSYITKDECVYHWGRAWKKRIAGSLENRYNCCQGDLQSEGCSLARLHVSENIDYDNLAGFVTTLPKTPPCNGNYGVYALDCEMCYTVNGNELTRITVIGKNLKPVYETLVKPESPIIDYNTRFSGITEEDMAGVTTTIRDVQAVLLSKFNDKTILIGHSLESDFKALKLIHDTVVDTSIVFPHRLGPPYKRALRNLMADYLKKIIQNSVEGHDSQEDAVACMELMIYKIKEDYKKTLR